MAFLISTVTLLFRPAKTAVVPAIVKERDLVAANSAMSVPETAADLIGYPVAGLIVTALASVIGAAFALDAVTYVRLRRPHLEHGRAAPGRGGAGADVHRIGLAGDARGIRVPLERARASLEHAAVDHGAGGRGAEIVVSLLYAKDVVDRGALSFEQLYSHAAHRDRGWERPRGDLRGRHRRAVAEGSGGDRRLHRHGPVAGRRRPW